LEKLRRNKKKKGDEVNRASRGQLRASKVLGGREVTPLREKGRKKANSSRIVPEKEGGLFHR